MDQTISYIPARKFVHRKGREGRKVRLAKIAKIAKIAAIEAWQFCR